LIVDDLLSYDSGLSCGQSVYFADGSAQKCGEQKYPHIY